MPGPIALQESCCAEPCESPVLVQTPGPAGAAGAAGTNGTNGISPVTSVTASFLMPAEGANVTVAVGTSEGMIVNQPVFVQTAGTMKVISKPNNISVVLQNLENTASVLYTDNAAPGTSIPAGSLVAPAGVQGAAGTLSGAASGQLKGTYPGPKLNIGETKGMLIVGNGTDADELSVGADATVLHARSAQALGQQWSALDMSGVNTSLTGTLPVARGGTGGTLPIANGGTGQTAADEAFDALAPTTTRGDMIVMGAAGDNVRVAVGGAFRVWVSNGTDPSWQFLSHLYFDPTVKVATRHTAILARQSIDLNAAAGSDTAVLLAYTMTNVIIRRIILEGASVNLSGSAARLGIYTSTAKGGTAVVTDPNSQLTGLTSAAKFVELTLAASMATDVLTVPGPPSVLYIHLSAAHGTAATVRMTIFADDLSA